MATGPTTPESTAVYPRSRWADRLPRPVLVAEPSPPVAVTPAPVVMPEQGFQLTGTQLVIGAIILILLLKK